MNRLKLANIGQLRVADLEFGDLTVFVGPQATGKSIALQFLKLVEDSGPIRTRLGEYGVDWDKQIEQFFDVFFGEGMSRLWRPDESSIEVDGGAIDLAALLKKKGRRKERSMFFIPAQRVLALREGWPRPFSDYGAADPFTVRDFSDELRLLMESGLKGEDMLFPKSNRLKGVIRDVVDEAVFHGFGLKVDRTRPQKRLVLGPEANGQTLPFMVWSAGQREFVPLLLGLYWLMPGARTTKREEIEWVVIEELEMGLHPRAISATMLLVLELLWRGYRVCLSTHSSQVLDIIWALRVFRESGGQVADVLDLFSLPSNGQTKPLAEAALVKTTKVHYFTTEGTVHDISRLDPGAEDRAEAGWGGLTQFSGDIGEVVSRVVRRYEAQQASAQAEAQANLKLEN
jgi:hypothetical protein